MNVGYRDIITQMVHNQGNNNSIHVANTDLRSSTCFNDSPHEYHEVTSQFELKEEANFELMVEDGPLCVLQTQVSPEDLHEHTNPSLMVEDDKDEKIKSALDSNPSFHEDYNKHDDSNYLSFCYVPFEFMRQKLRASKKVYKHEDMDNSMEFVGVDNQKGEQIESYFHSNPPFYEQADNQPNVL